MQSVSDRRESPSETLIICSKSTETQSGSIYSLEVAFSESVSECVLPVLSAPGLYTFSATQ